MRSAAVLETPKMLCVQLSRLICSSTPFQLAWLDEISNRVSCSTKGSRFGLSPYTLFVDVKINTDSGRCLRHASSRMWVPRALILKSVNGSLAAQSCDGWPAAWMTREMGC